MSLMFLRLARFGTVLALLVVMLGAWVRLSDAGLGCPDWPGCYGRIIVPDHATAAPDLIAQRPLEAGKAWREMIHRYLAGTLGFVCVALAAIAWRNRKNPNQPWRRPLARSPRIHPPPATPRRRAPRRRPASRTIPSRSPP